MRRHRMPSLCKWCFYQDYQMLKILTTKEKCGRKYRFVHTILELRVAAARVLGETLCERVSKINSIVIDADERVRLCLLFDALAQSQTAVLR